MGRFDALTQIDEKQEVKSPQQAPVVPDKKIPKAPEAVPTSQNAAFAPLSLPATKNQPRDRQKPENLNSGIHENVSPTEAMQDKPQKYSTLLHGASIKKIKLYAAE